MLQGIGKMGFWWKGKCKLPKGYKQAVNFVEDKSKAPGALKTEMEIARRLRVEQAYAGFDVRAARWSKKVA